jgi:hypothetical protein
MVLMFVRWVVLSILMLANRALPLWRGENFPVFRGMKLSRRRRRQDWCESRLLLLLLNSIFVHEV